MSALFFASSSFSAAYAAEAKKPEHWLKKCITNEQSIRTCFVAEAIILENAKKKVKIQLASIRIKSISNTKRLSMYIQVPNRILLQSGLRFQIDKGKTRVSPFSICYDQACEAEINLNSKFVKDLKKGNEISLYFLKFDGKPVTIKVPLKGFTAGFNSKGVELKQSELPPQLRNAIKKANPPATKEKVSALPEAKPLPDKK